MTTASPGGAPVRPRRPPPGLFAVGATLAAIALTVATAANWRYGTGFAPGDIVRKLTNFNPVLSALPHAELDQLLSPRSRAAFVETLRQTIIGGVSGSLVALPIALWSTSYGAPNRTVQVVVRFLSNIIRAFPDLLWALLFVAAVGIGNLPGVLALFFFSIAVVTKLTADTLDGIDMGPIEAAHASGARHSQMLRTAVVPQILPAYTSYALYAFELNLRASTVLGLVGAGGIGQRLQFFQSQNDWEKVWGLVVMFVLVVFVVDRASTLLRRRLV
ncbi:phosphonate ABC transporter, permease protein PhnE [soil metagenome]